MWTSIVHGMSVENVFVWPDPDQESRFFYLPRTVDCQRREDGRPAAQLIAAGDRAFLQMSTFWDVPAEQLEEMRRIIADELEIENPALVQLAFAPAKVESVRLLAGDGEVVEDELATARSSGMSPHSALFNLTVSGDDRNRALAAFNGRERFLLVRYEVSVNAPIAHSALLVGDLSSVEGSADVERALESGRARLQMDPADTPLRDAFIARAVDLLRMMEPAAADGPVEMRIDLVANETRPVNIDSDVGTWFGSGDTPILPAAGERLSRDETAALSPNVTLPANVED